AEISIDIRDPAFLLPENRQYLMEQVRPYLSGGRIVMPIMQWNVRYLVGIQEIDQHHKHLVELLNKTYDEFREGAEIEKSTIDELVDFSGYHFSYEERLMVEL